LTNKDKENGQKILKLDKQTNKLLIKLTNIKTEKNKICNKTHN